MARGHDHDHGELSREGSVRALSWTLGLVVLYMGAEVVGGLLANSLALLADAGHMLSDAGSLALALFALWIARRPPTPERSYGYYRTEILAALANGVTLVVVALLVFREAWHRFHDPPEVAGALMMAIATGGLLVNVAGLWILREARSGSLNMRGAWLHVLADAAGSAGAVVAGGLIWLLGWRWVDPLASVLIGCLVLASSWRLLQESTAVLMQMAPGHIDVDRVRDALMSVEGVEAVHDLHVWTVTSGIESLSAHVVVKAGRSARETLSALRRAVYEPFGIDHVTIQLEPPGFEERETEV